MINSKFFFSGYSLVELMISLMLSSFLCLMLFKIYLLVKENYLYQITKLRQRHEQVLVINELRQQLSQAGFSSCINLNRLWAKQGFASIQLLAPQDKSIPRSIARRAIKSGTVIKTQQASGVFSKIIKASSAYRIVVESSENFRVGDKVVIANCNDAQINTVSAIANKNNLIRLKQAINPSVVKHGVIAHFKTQWYFVGINSRGKVGLYIHDGRNEELSDYVQSLYAQWVGTHIVELKLKFIENTQVVDVGINGL